MKKISILVLLGVPFLAMAQNYQQLPTVNPVTKQDVALPGESIVNSAGLQVQPQYPGGIAAFYNFINTNFKLPSVDHDMVARIYISFIVEKDGSMAEIKVLRDPGYGFGAEAARVLSLIPEKWQPGMQNGAAVRASYNLPITINVTNTPKTKQ